MSRISICNLKAAKTLLSTCFEPVNSLVGLALQASRINAAMRSTDVSIGPHTVAEQKQNEFTPVPRSTLPDEWRCPLSISGACSRPLEEW